MKEQYFTISISDKDEKYIRFLRQKLLAAGLPREKAVIVRRKREEHRIDNKEESNEKYCVEHNTELNADNNAGIREKYQASTRDKYINGSNGNFDEAYITCQYRNKSIRLRIDNIIFVASSKHGSRVYTLPKNSKTDINNCIPSNRMLAELYEVLKDYNFSRIHESYIINMKYIKRKTIRELELVNGTLLSIARAKEPEFREKYRTYLNKQEDCLI